MSNIRKEIQRGAISIAYGHDSIGGYFLHVTDTRLQTEVDDPAWDEVCEGIHLFGDGTYLFVSTSEHGHGKTIDKKLIERLWKAYNVPEEGLALLNVKMQVLTDMSYEALVLRTEPRQ